MNRNNAVLNLLTFVLISISSSMSFAGNVTPDAADHGDIFFLSKKPIANNTSNSDIAKEIDLKDAKNLYLKSTLPKPLTQYLRELAPDMTDSQLNSQGNYQFTFKVNNTKVYTENLNFGAGLPHQKSQNTVLSIPLFSEQNEDSWGRFLWMRFMHYAGEEAFIEGRHSLSIEIRAYLKAPELKVGELIAKGELAVNVKKPHVTEAQIAIQPIAEGSGWALSSASFDKEKIRALNKKIAQQDFKHIKGIVIIKRNQLLLEQYYNGSNRNTLHDARSVGKSFASSLLGIAIKDGHIKSDTQTLDRFYPLENYRHFSTEKASVTLENLLTMSSAFDGDDNDPDSPGQEERIYPTNDWVKYILDLPMSDKARPGKDWAYFTGSSILLGDIVHHKVPGGLADYADQKLFQPLGIANYQWQFTPTNVANTAGGIQLRALDFAKYGQLYQNGGTWQGNDILDKHWVEKSISPLVDRTEEMGGGHYGYLFWHDAFSVNQKKYEVAYATGNGGNKIYIFKNKPFVVVINASAYGKSYAHTQVNKIMANYILPAIDI